MLEQDPDEVDHIELFARVSRQPPPLSARAAKRRCLVGLTAWFALAGAISPFVTEHSQADSALSIIFAFLGLGMIFMWCLYDSHERSYHVNLLLRVLIVALAAVGIPVYLLLTRGFRGIISIVLMVLFFGACVLLAFLTEIITCILFGIPLDTIYAW